MRKKKELSEPGTCMDRAHPEEMTFVLVGRDPAAPATIRAWAEERIRLGKNERGDLQITEALNAANIMTDEGNKWKSAPRRGEKGEWDIWVAARARRLLGVPRNLEIHRYDFSISIDFVLGTAEKKYRGVQPKISICPDTITTNAPVAGMFGVLDLQCGNIGTMIGGKTDAKNLEQKSLVLVKVDHRNEIGVHVEYSGIIPPPYVVGQKFTFSISLGCWCAPIPYLPNAEEEGEGLWAQFGEDK
jgi:hypothetical protein